MEGHGRFILTPSLHSCINSTLRGISMLCLATVCMLNPVCVYVYIIFSFLFFCAADNLSSYVFDFQPVCIPGSEDATTGAPAHEICPADCWCPGGGRLSQFWTWRRTDALHSRHRTGNVGPQWDTHSHSTAAGASAGQVS